MRGAALAVLLGALVILSVVRTATAVSETWTDEFNDTTLVHSYESVSIDAGHVHLSPNALHRQGLQRAGNIIAPSIIQVGSGYYMYYSGCCLPTSIMLATSTDSNNWTEQGVVLAPGASGSSDSGGVTYEDVVLVGSTFHMWYSGAGPSGDYAIHHASSADGRSWRSDGVTISAASEGISGSVYEPSVLWDGAMFTMWFGHYDGSHISIRMATSADGLSWTSHGVVLGPLANGIENFGATMPDVLRTGTGFLMWYACAAVWEGQICRADSSDGVTWVRKGVVLGPDPNLPGENVGLSMPTALSLSPGTYRIW